MLTTPLSASIRQWQKCLSHWPYCSAWMCLLLLFFSLNRSVLLLFALSKYQHRNRILPSKCNLHHIYSFSLESKLLSAVSAKATWSSIFEHNYLLIGLLNLFRWFFYSFRCVVVAGCFSQSLSLCLSVDMFAMLQNEAPKKNIWECLYGEIASCEINILFNFSQRPLNFRRGNKK